MTITNQFPKLAAIVICALCVSPMMSNWTFAQNAAPAFRVDTQIFAELGKPPIKETITIFSNGNSYDFSNEKDGIITVLNPERKTISLLDPKRQVKVDIDTAGLQRNLEAAAAIAPPDMKKVTTEQWSEVENEGRTFEVGNNKLSYHVTVMKAAIDGAAKQYADFASWSARLNAQYETKTPPYIRLRLNDAMAKEDVLPEKVKRTLDDHFIYAISDVEWKLGESDQKRIAFADEMALKFVSIPPDRFWAK